MPKRDKSALIKRDKKIVARFREMDKKHLRYDYIVKQLAEEFFLGEFSIQRILREGTNESAS